MFSELPLLSLLIWAPIFGGLWVLYAGDRQEETVKYLTLGVSIITFLLSIFLYIRFDTSTWEMQFVEKTSWISTFNIYYHLGVDGIAELGLALYTNYLYPFEIAGAILLVAIIAAISLTMRKPRSDKAQKPERQVAVKKSKKPKSPTLFTRKALRPAKMADSRLNQKPIKR